MLLPITKSKFALIFFRDCRTNLQTLKFYVLTKNLGFFHFWSLRLQALKPAEQDEFLDFSQNLGPWQRRSDFNLDRASHESIPLESREPDGASSEEYPAVSEEDHEDVEEKDGGVLSSNEDVYLKDAKGKKKKRQRSLFACLTPARLSFRKKSERVNESKTNTT